MSTALTGSRVVCLRRSMTETMRPSASRTGSKDMPLSRMRLMSAGSDSCRTERKARCMALSTGRSSVTPASSALRTSPSVRVPTILPPESVTSSVITSPERLLSVSSATRSEASEDIMCLSGKSCPVIFVSIYTPTTCYPPLRFPISASATIQSVGESMSILRSRGISTPTLLGKAPMA